MLTHLAQETQPHHASADGDRLAIMESPSAVRYQAFLSRVYGFEAPVEAALAATPGLDRRLVRSFLKTHQLATDLRALCVAPERIEPFGPIRFESVPAALGWMWVLHRNTLVHGLIFRFLQGRLPECARTAGRYFAAVEGRAGLLMRELGTALCDTAHRVAAMTQVTDAAAAAFRAQHHWYNRDQLATPRPARITGRQQAA